jgi:hypothetical protein
MAIRCDGGTEKRFARWLGPHLDYAPQGAGDLGQRMFRSFVNAFTLGCRRVVLVGTDIPELHPRHLAEAFGALSDYDLVLGPSTDGGYWLIGLKKPHAVFHPVDWGTGEVLRQTDQLARKQGLRVHHLNPQTDVDTPEDLYQMKRPWEAKPYVSTVIPTLNEGEAIGPTLEKARSPDAEILVVDGGSSDDTIQQALDAGATVVTSPQGRSRQQNRGARLAEGRVLLFLHADTHLPPHYPRHIFEALMDPSTAGGAFRFKTDLRHPLMKLIEAVAHVRSRFLRLPYGDQGLFLRKSLFTKLGGFPEVPIAEEIFFLRRLSKLGRISTLRTEAVTSARRWVRFGLVRTTWINQVVLLGCSLGASPHRLAGLYRNPMGTREGG